MQHLDAARAGDRSPFTYRARRHAGRPLRATAFVAILVCLGSLPACRLFTPNTIPFDASRDLTGELPVFPGAQGFGTTTTAGRGGDVVKVTSLAESGPGTLREALAETSGARTVIFEVAGSIDLSADIHIREPFATVAGQTAPDPGITLIGAGIVVNTHDVLIQHIRARPGDRPDGPDPESRDGISVVGDRRGETAVYNVVIDHCSVSWAIDEGVSTWYANVRDVTFSNSIIAEQLSDSLHPENEHSKGLLIGDHSRRITVIGNLFAHNMRRNPMLKGDTSAIVAGNLIYNPGTAAIDFSDREFSGPSRTTITNNVLIRGPDTAAWLRMITLASRVYDTMQIYHAGNIDLIIDDDADGPTATPDPPTTARPFQGSPEIADVTVSAPPVSLEPLDIPAVEEVYETVLTTAGARPSARDGIDRRIVQSVRTRSGVIIDSQEEVGGFPNPAPTTRTLTVPDRPAADDDGNGYTNLEEWLWTF
jgi:hypothetical protein